MIVLLWNVLLAFFWTSISGEFHLGNLFFGLLIGYFVLFIARRTLGIEWYFAKTKAFFSLIRVLFFELIHSSLKIAYDILTAKHIMRPGIIKVPLDAESPLEITLFSNLISLTPGTLSIYISEESRELYVHVMYLPATSEADVCRKLKQKYESLILELLR